MEEAEEEVIPMILKCPIMEGPEAEKLELKSHLRVWYCYEAQRSLESPYYFSFRLFPSLWWAGVGLLAVHDAFSYVNFYTIIIMTW